jgi:hypothetical protein
MMERAAEFGAGALFDEWLNIVFGSHMCAPYGFDRYCSVWHGMDAVAKCLDEAQLVKFNARRNA